METLKLKEIEQMSVLPRLPLILKDISQKSNFSDVSFCEIW